MYVPEEVPHSEDIAALGAYIGRELARISNSLQTGIMQFNVLHAEPIRLREGLLVMADGVDWDPGSGGGLYVYFGGSWSKCST